MITIGKAKLATSTPTDLDAALIEATGCTAAETRAMLAGQPQASHLARALHPFLAEKDALAVPDLATQIAAVEDRTGIAADVLGLYDKALSPAPAPASKSA